jgi:hypothetical protein
MFFHSFCTSSNISLAALEQVPKSLKFISSLPVATASNSIDVKPDGFAIFYTTLYTAQKSFNS